MKRRASAAAGQPPRLVVRPQHPRRRILLIGLVVAALGLGGWGLWILGRDQGGHELGTLRADSTRLRHALAARRAQVTRLQQQLADLRQARTVDLRSGTDLRHTVEQLQDKILELRQEVSFYRGIVSPADAQAGLGIEEVQLQQAGGPHQYYYRLVLIQALRHERRVSGRVHATAYGERNGDAVSLPLDQFDADHKGSLRFSFRYFQELDGMFVFPKGFVPARIEFKVRPDGRGGKEVRRSYDWAQLFGQESSG